MIFRINNILKTESQLSDHILIDKGFVTYATSNSFRVDSELECPFRFVADGWPVAVYSSILAGEKVNRLSFFKLRDFWLEIAKTTRIGIVGYEEKFAIELSNALPLINITPVLVNHGFLSDTEIIQLVQGSIGTVDVFFLGIGQPRQEYILKKLEHLEGSISIVCCGAFWIQEICEVKGVGKISTMLGLVSIYRFWHSPRTLFERTLLSLCYLLKNLKSNDDQ